MHPNPYKNLRLKKKCLVDKVHNIKMGRKWIEKKHQQLEPKIVATEQYDVNNNEVSNKKVFKK